MPCYFAFGSNMNADRMHERLGWSAKRFAATLPDFRLLFNKQVPSGRWCVANITPAPGQSVEGIAYTLKHRDLDVLDGYEGVAEGHYERLPVTIFTASGEAFAAIAYSALKTGPEFPPTREYLNHLLAGQPLLNDNYFQRLQQTPVYNETPAKEQHWLSE